jgi:hypothetical protein
MEMALRIEKRTGALLIGLALLAPAAFGEQLRYEVWHGQSRVARVPPHIKKVGERGTLTVTDSGISFAESPTEGKQPKHPHAWHWDYQDIQQLKIAPNSMTVLTYKDNKWKLGADRAYEFDLASDGTFANAYELLKGRLDQRLVGAILENCVSDVLWEIPVKHLLRFGGDEGVLQVGASEIVYKSARPRESRTWRYADIDNISSSGPFQLGITTFERAKLDYGSRKEFNFELKQRLDDARYNDLWLRLNRSKGLRVLNSYREGGSGQ